jgi:hypothetical protein
MSTTFPPAVTVRSYLLPHPTRHPSAAARSIRARLICTSCANRDRGTMNAGCSDNQIHVFSPGSPCIGGYLIIMQAKTAASNNTEVTEELTPCGKREDTSGQFLEPQVSVQWTFVPTNETKRITAPYVLDDDYALLPFSYQAATRSRSLVPAPGNRIGFVVTEDVFRPNTSMATVLSFTSEDRPLRTFSSVKDSRLRRLGALEKPALDRMRLTCLRTFSGLTASAPRSPIRIPSISVRRRGCELLAYVSELY